MTDSPTPAEPGPVDPDVELASAHLDGEASADERARADEPAVRAQLAAFAGIAEQVRDVPPPPAGLIEEHLATAMGAFDDDARVVPLGRGRTPGLPRIPLGAVAAVLVVVAFVGILGIASLAGRGEDDADDTASATLDAADERVDDDFGGGGGEGGDDSSGAEADDAEGEESAALESAAGFGAGDERMTFESYDELAEAIGDELGSSGATSAAPGGGASDGQQPTTTAALSRGAGEDGDPTDPCGAVEVLGIDRAAVVLVQPALVTPDPVTVVVHDTEDGRRLAVVDDATCEVVLDRLL